MSLQPTDKKKQIEIGYLEEARLASSIFPSGAFVSHEVPDFILPLDNGMLGIEVTELCREIPRREAARLKKIDQKAKMLYDSCDGAIPIDVSLAFSHHANDLSVKQLVDSLASFVYIHRHEKGRCESIKLPKGYCYIAIHEPLEEVDPTGRWFSCRAFDTAIASKEFIESFIAKKNDRLASYREAATEVWLLMINDQFLGAGEVYLREEQFKEWEFNFGFDKVLLFAREPGGTGQVLELRRKNN